MNLSTLMKEYLDYVGKSEAPAAYHRWSFIAAVSAAIGRKAFFQMGHFDIYPNTYIFLMGDPGARKSTAIGISRDILKRSGFKHFAGSKGSAERFYQDLESSGAEDLFSSSQQFVCADESSNFFGESNGSFIAGLTELFDAKPEFEARFKNSKSSIISNPCVGILGGFTHVSFGSTFPNAIMHNGFLSRVILIWGERTGVKLPFMATPDEGKRDALVQHFINLREASASQISVTPQAKDALSDIYMQWQELKDGRFVTYAQRRYTHLIKLAIISAAGTGKMVLEYDDIVFANTMLAAAEQGFSQALGEFGKSKNSEEATIIMNALYHSGPQTAGQLWSKVQTNLTKVDEMTSIIAGLVAAGKIIHNIDKFEAVKPPEVKLPHIDPHFFEEIQI